MNDETEFERQARQALQNGLERLDGATRSRLTQARYRALASLDDAGARSWIGRLAARSRVLAPAGAVAAVVALTTLLWVGRPDGSTPVDGIEDFEMLAEGEVLAAMSEEDPEFYEWALAQDEFGTAAVGS